MEVKIKIPEFHGSMRGNDFLDTRVHSSKEKHVRLWTSYEHGLE